MAAEQTYTIKLELTRTEWERLLFALRCAASQQETVYPGLASDIRQLENAIAVKLPDMTVINPSTLGSTMP